MSRHGISVSNLSAHLPRDAVRSTTWPGLVSADDLGRCGVTRGAEEQCVGAALASHGRGHRFETCHAHQRKQVPESPSRAWLPADCQQTTLNRRQNALSVVRIECLDNSRRPPACKARSAQLVSCDCRKRTGRGRCGRCPWLSAGGPVRTAVTGTQIAWCCLPGCWHALGRGPRPPVKAARGRRGAMRTGASILDRGGVAEDLAAGQTAPSDRRLAAG